MWLLKYNFCCKVENIAGKGENASLSPAFSAFTTFSRVVFLGSLSWDCVVKVRNDGILMYYAKKLKSWSPAFSLFLLLF